MLNMAWRNDISVNVVIKIPIMVDGRKQRYQTSKYTILNNVAYYVHHDWDKNHKVWETVVATFHWYVHEGCGFKLVMQTFIYNILPRKEEGC